MVISKYVQIIRDYPHKGKSVIYSFLHDSLCIVNDRIFKVLEKASGITEVRRQLSKDEYETLSRIRVLRDTDERKACRELLERMMNVGENLNLIVYLTYDCNLKCTYCFQPHKRKSLAMSKDTARALLKWIVSFCEDKSIKNLYVLFYGGEPLLNRSVLEYIASGLSRFSKLAGIKCRFLVTTNGTLLDVEFVKRLEACGLSDIQVTLDGLRDEHDRRKPFKSGETSSYDRILENLQAISKVTAKTVLRINFDKQNAYNVPALLRLVKERKLDKKVRVHMMPVHQPVQNWEKGSGSLIQSKELSDYLLRFYSVARQLELSIVPYYAASICQFYGKFSFSITPEGYIYKCPNLLQGRFRVGTIYNGVSERKNDRVRHIDLQECLSCKFIPICAKGCRHQAYVLRKGISGKFCERLALEGLVDFYIKHEVRERLNKNGR